MFSTNFNFWVKNLLLYKFHMNSFKKNLIKNYIFIAYSRILFKNIWGLGIGDWGLGIGPNPQSPIPNPQSPILFFYFYVYLHFP